MPAQPARAKTIKEATKGRRIRAFINNTSSQVNSRAIKTVATAKSALLDRVNSSVAEHTQMPPRRVKKRRVRHND
ncbi:hypothetical protein EMIT043CA1_190111 [Pseudomonas brassicacearum]